MELPYRGGKTVGSMTSAALTRGGEEQGTWECSSARDGGQGVFGREGNGGKKQIQRVGTWGVGRILGGRLSKMPREEGSILVIWPMGATKKKTQHRRGVYFSVGGNRRR